MFILRGFLKRTERDGKIIQMENDRVKIKREQRERERQREAFY